MWYDKDAGRAVLHPRFSLVRAIVSCLLVLKNPPLSAVQPLGGGFFIYSISNSLFGYIGLMLSIVHVLLRPKDSRWTPKNNQLFLIRWFRLGVALFFHFVAVAFEKPSSLQTKFGFIPFFSHSLQKFYQNISSPPCTKTMFKN